MFIVRSSIRSLAKSKGKRVSASYIQYLERRVVEIVTAHMSSLGSRATLNIQDAQAGDIYRSTKA